MTFKIGAKIIGLALFVSSFSSYAALNQNEPLWLSGSPPNMDLAKELRRSHGGVVLRDDEGNFEKVLWLRSGGDFNRARYLTESRGQFYLLDRQSKLQKPLAFEADPKHVTIKFPMPDEGYYDAYYLQREVKEGVQYVSVAKQEVLKHNCRLGHNFDVNEMQPQSLKQAPLELLRLRFDDENFHTRFNSGRVARFKVLFNGKPLAGAAVTISTEEGWKRKSKSDSEGIVSFQVIQDRFKENEEKKAEKKVEESRGGHGGNRQRSEQFLVAAKYTEKVPGDDNGIPYNQTIYTTTFPGTFSASQSVYKSYAYGLTFGSAGFLVLGVGSYMYRRRRIKPFKEVNLDE